MGVHEVKTFTHAAKFHDLSIPSLASGPKRLQQQMQACSMLGTFQNCIDEKDIS